MIFRKWAAQMHQNDPIRQVPIFQVNLGYLERCLLCIAFPVCLAIHFPFSFYLGGGGHLRYETSFLEYLQLSCLAFGLTVFLLVSVFKITRNWKFTFWNKNAVPYICLMEDSIVLLGNTKIYWKAIPFFRYVAIDFRLAPYRTYLIFGIPGTLKGKTSEIPHFRKLTEHNSLIRVLHREKYNADIEHNSFLCVSLDEKSQLSLPTDEIIRLIENLWTNVGEYTDDEPNQKSISIVPDESFTENGSNVPSKLSGVFGHFLVGLMTACLLGLAISDLYAPVIAQVERVRWPAAEGKIISSQIASGCSNPAESFPAIKYQYQVSNLNFIGSKVDGNDLDLRIREHIPAGSRTYFLDIPIGENRCVSASRANEIAANYPNGASIRVYYNPLEPHESILVNSSVPNTILVELLAVCFLIFVFGFVMLTHVRIALGRGNVSRDLKLPLLT